MRSGDMTHNDRRAVNFLVAMLLNVFVSQGKLGLGLGRGFPQN